MYNHDRDGPMYNIQVCSPSHPSPPPPGENVERDKRGLTGLGRRLGWVGGLTCVLDEGRLGGWGG